MKDTHITYEYCLQKHFIHCICRQENEMKLPFYQNFKNPGNAIVTFIMSYLRIQKQFSIHRSFNEVVQCTLHQNLLKTKSFQGNSNLIIS